MGSGPNPESICTIAPAQAAGVDPADATAPVVTVPDNQQVAAEGPAGAVVSRLVFGAIADRIGRTTTTIAAMNTMLSSRQLSGTPATIGYVAAELTDPGIDPTPPFPFTVW